MLIIHLVILLSFSISLQAEASTSPDYPKGCVKLSTKTHERKLIIDKIKNVDTRIILLYNKSEYDQWVKVEPKAVGEQTEAGVNAGWTSQFKKGRWSAFLFNDRPLEIACVEIKPGSEQYVDCQQNLTLCELKNFKLDKDSKGTYWLAEDETLANLMLTIHARGV